MGLDLDNTLIDYQRAYGFLVAEVLSTSEFENQVLDKDAAKNLILEHKGSLAWTEAQGKLYSEYLTHADFFPGALDFLKSAQQLGLEIKIVSHKTKYPFVGPRVDLQACAEKWLHDKLPYDIFRPVLSKNLFFEETKDSKVKRILELKCESFVDDLAEILEALPTNIARIHFRGSSENGKFVKVSSWTELIDLIQ